MREIRWMRSGSQNRKTVRSNRSFCRIDQLHHFPLPQNFSPPPTATILNRLLKRDRNGRSSRKLKADASLKTSIRLKVDGGGVGFFCLYRRPEGCPNPQNTREESFSTPAGPKIIHGHQCHLG